MKYQNLKTFTLLIITSVFLFSCNKDDLVEVKSETNGTPESANQSFKLTEEEAIENLQSFLNEFDQPSESDISTRSKPIRTIADIQVIGKNEKNTGALVNDDQSTLRSLLSTAQTDTILYLINFEDAGGFAIVSADKRSNKVYAIIDEGTLDANEIDKVDNPGFNMFMENAILSELSNVDNYDLSYESESLTELRAREEPIRVNPLLKTKWGQGYPYSVFCPNETTGCIPTAVAQILSYYQPMSSISYYDIYNDVNRSSNLTWSKIISDCVNASNYGQLTNYNAPQSSLQVAHLMFCIGIGVKAQYKPTGETGSSTAFAVSWFRNNGFSKLLKSESYDVEAVYNALVGGNLVYMAGGNINNIHAWVVDGAFISSSYRSPSTIGSYHLHCNWGWDGFCDGYYLDFDLSKGAGLDAIDPGGSRNANYNYSAHMVIMKR